MEQTKSQSRLQVRKQYGKLFNASNDVIKVCKTAEYIFRTYNDILNSKNVITKLILLTMQTLTVNDLFLETEHVFNQAPLMDHRNQLIRMLLQKYFVRLHYHGESKNYKTERIRLKFTKLILFKNQ